MDYRQASGRRGFILLNGLGKRETDLADPLQKSGACRFGPRHGKSPSGALWRERAGARGVSRRGEEMSASAAARLQAMGMFRTLAMRTSALGLTASPNQIKRSIAPSAINSASSRWPPRARGRRRRTPGDSTTDPPRRENCGKAPLPRAYPSNGCRRGCAGPASRSSARPSRRAHSSAGRGRGERFSFGARSTRR